MAEIIEKAERPNYAQQLLDKLYQETNVLDKSHYCHDEIRSPWHTNYTIVAMLAQKFKEDNFTVEIETTSGSMSKMHRVLLKWGLPATKEEHKQFIIEQDYLDAYNKQRMIVLSTLKDKYDIADEVITDIEEQLFHERPKTRSIIHER